VESGTERIQHLGRPETANQRHLIYMSKIDLGKKWGDKIKSMGDPISENSVDYPSLHIDDIEDRRLAEMPDSGTLTIHYKIRNRTHSERKEKDKKKHSCSVTLDVTHIDPPAGKSKKNGDSDGGARKALSDYFKDK
jgi:hypothetical protein